MRTIIELEGDHIEITLIAETDIEQIIVRNMQQIEVGRSNGNIVLTRVTAEVRKLEAR